MIKNLSILLVEDDDVAAEAVTRSLKKVDPKIKIIWKQNGKLALDALREKAQQKVSGRVLKVDQSKNKYRVKVLQKSGRVVSVDVDKKSGKVSKKKKRD